MSDLTLQQLVLRLVAYVFIAAVHGFAVAVTAVAMGDRGPGWDDRRTLNPLGHLDIIGTVSGVLFSVGWIRPIAIDPAALRLGRAGLVIIVAIAAVATLASAVALRLLRPWLLPQLSDTVSATAFSWVETVGALSVWFALFNLLPVPPLTGAHLLTAAVPAWDKFLRRIAPYSGLALAVIAATGLFATALGPSYRTISRLLFGS